MKNVSILRRSFQRSMFSSAAGLVQNTRHGFSTLREEPELGELMEFLNNLNNFEKSGVPIGAGTDSEYGFDLGRMSRLVGLLGNPQSRFKTVHIAGTKGKGSTAAFLSSILRAEGYSVGCYTSPHIQTIRERITLGRWGEPISAKALNHHFKRRREVLERAVKLENGCLSHFEVLTAIAFSLFAEENTEIAVVEAGLGGARDATNVISASDLALSIITTVGEEHLEALGGSLESIAVAKSGIVKHGRPLVLGGPFIPYIERILRGKAFSMSSPVVSASDPGNRSALRGFCDVSGIPRQLCDIVLQIVKDFDLSIELLGVKLRMLGAHQLQNAVTATCSALCLNKQERSRSFSSYIKIDEENLRWVCDALKQASQAKGNRCKRWGRKVQAYTYRVFQNFNSYGRYVRIEAWLGDRKSAVIIPEGGFNWGWEDIADKIFRFLGNGNISKFNLYVQDTKSFMDVAKIPQWQDKAPKATKVGPNNAEIGIEMNKDCYLSKCLIGRFNDPFNFSPNIETIQKWFTNRWQISAGIKISALKHNLFLFDFPSRHEASRILAGEWLWNGRKLSLEWWSPTGGSESTNKGSEQCWVKAFGIPIHAWAINTFRIIGDLCGGYIDIDEDTRNRSHLQWARICIKASDRTSPATIELEIGDWCCEISIIDDVHVKPKPVRNLISPGVKINAAIVKSNSSIEANLSEVPSSSKHVPNHVGNFNSKIGTSGRSVTKQPHRK